MSSVESSGDFLLRDSRPAASATTLASPAWAARGRALLAGCAWGLAAAAAFAVYLRLAHTRAVNSDGAAQALQAWDMLHGNPLLHGWTTSDVSFYTTELPQYMLVELARGLGAGVVPVAAAMTYTLVVLLAALVAKGTATGRAGLARATLAAGIMLAPQLSSGTNVLLSSPDHIGTSVPLLAAWLVLDRARPGWRATMAVSALLALALVADSITLVAGVGPLLLACALRMARGGPRHREVALASGAVAAAGVAVAAGHLIHALGGYTVRPLAPHFAPPGEVFAHNIPVAAQSLLLLPGADFIGLPAGAATWFTLFHLAGASLALTGVALAAWRWRRDDDLVSQVLLAGVVVNLLAFVVSTKVVAVSSAREIAPVLPLAAALAGRQLARHLTVPRPARPAAVALLAVAGTGYLAGLGLELTAPAAPPQASLLTAWLERHPLGTGLSGYWAASVVTLASGGRAAVRPVVVRGGRVVPAAGEVRASWFDPRRSTARFVVLFPGVPAVPGVPAYPGFTDRDAVLATFGRPARTYHVGEYTILAWGQNLLGDLTASGSGPVSAGSPTGTDRSGQSAQRTRNCVLRNRAGGDVAGQGACGTQNSAFIS